MAGARSVTCTAIISSISLSHTVRDEIIAAGQAQPHHVLPDTGWVSFHIRQESDVDQAIALLRRSYEIAMAQHGNRGPD